MAINLHLLFSSALSRVVGPAAALALGFLKEVVDLLWRGRDVGDCAMDMLWNVIGALAL